MSRPAIAIQGITKEYRLGTRRSDTLRDALTARWRAAAGKAAPPAPAVPAGSFLALRGVSFTVEKGEAVGILGANGAGKSTLLKILSQITEPTAGEIRMRGRVASLIEVGTGFHPELSGRENIFLNGAILGMRRREIKARFDEIVAFAEVEQFLDTPVKRYSSGMYVRLAFSVAAHLEPEILIIDEILSVGDARFQQKCLGRLREAAQQGRTILFVSHDMTALLRFCTRCVLLQKGEVAFIGSPAEAIARYFSAAGEQPRTMQWEDRPPEAQARVRLLSAELASTSEYPWQIPYGEEIELLIAVETRTEVSWVELGLALYTATDFELASATSGHALPREPLGPGRWLFRLRYTGLRLVPGLYKFSLGLRTDRGVEHVLPEAFTLKVLASPLSVAHETTTLRGVLVPAVDFQFERLPAPPAV